MRLLCTFLLLACAFSTAWGGAPRIIFIAGEYEYLSKETLPPYARELGRRYVAETSVLERPEDPKQQTIPGLEALQTADLVVLLVRRMTLPEKELNEIKAYIKSGRPLVALRTSSHAFENWKEFDAQVLGGNYRGHHGNRLKTTVTIVPEARNHPILKGVTSFVSDGSLYRTSPLHSNATPLLMGTVEGHPPEPLAWTREEKGARVFYTSLGHPHDFKEESFLNLLHNGIEWALGKPLEAREKK